jgi:hypothetical protein
MKMCSATRDDTKGCPMPKFLVTYHGGDGMPSSPEARQQVMAAFSAWAASVGDAMVDPGAPLIAMKTVSDGSVNDGPATGPVGGYTLLKANDLDAAVKLVESHPFVRRGGSLQVSEAAVLGDS